MIPAGYTSEQRPSGEGDGWLKSVFVGVFAGAGIGCLWATLYWRGGDSYAAAIIAFGGAVGLGVAVVSSLLRRLGRGRLAPTTPGLVGVLIGCLWCAPILLFLVDYKYFDIRSDGTGAAIAVSVMGASALLGWLLGAVSRPIVALALVLVFACMAPAVSYLSLTGPPAPSVTILNRIGAPVPVGRETNRRLMVLGIDGATWSVIRPLVEEGKLPHLESLMERGSYGVLESVPTASGDTASPVVWTSVFTGMTPAHHGISNWFVSDSRNRKTKALWNILNQNKKQAIVVNVPGTFPPEKILGAMISGFPIPGVVRPDSERLHVSVGRFYSNREVSLARAPVTRLDFGAGGRTSTEAPESFSPVKEADLPVVENMEARHGRLRHRAYDLRFGNLFLELMERRGFVPAQRLGSYVLRLADGSDDGEANYDTLYIYSDPGEGGPVNRLRRGEWSEWLGVEYKGVELFFKLHLLDVSSAGVDMYATPLFQSSSKPVIPFTYPVRLASRLHAETGQYVVEGAGWLIFEDEVLLSSLYEHTLDIGEVRLRSSEYLLDEISDWSLFVHLFTESDRIQHPFWRFHEPDAYESVSPSLVAAHGGRVRGTMEEIDKRLGRLLARADEDTIVAVLSDHGFQASPETGRGRHHPDGIYIIAGPGIRTGGMDAAPRASVLDVTPTLLHVMGFPVAEDMDGRVVTEILEDAPSDCCPIQWIPTYDPDARSTNREQFIDESTMEQLKSLGYVQ